MVTIANQYENLITFLNVLSQIICSVKKKVVPLQTILIYHPK